MSVGPLALKAIRVLWDRRGYKGMSAVPALRVTEATRALWGHREFLALPVREGQEEILDR